MELTDLKEKFYSLFSSEPTIFRAPGRVNIIGEHTDYNDGLVLPFPIKQSIYFAATLREDEYLHVHTIDLKKSAIIDTNKVHEKDDWTRFFYSALCVLKNENHHFKGINVVTMGDIPFGAGISSSSALTCGFLYSLIQLNHLPISKKDIVFLASKAENGTGVNGGKMDQFSICMGQKGKALFIDCKDYSYQLIDNELDDAHWVLFNTNVIHNLADTEYNDRRSDCDQAIASINKEDHNIQSARDLTNQMLKNYNHLISRTQYVRLKHVINENERVEKMIDALSTKDLRKAGDLLLQSHESLSKDYEVSCEELDFVVDFLRQKAYCYGARMMGGGFGGSVIALIDSTTNDFSDIASSYFKKFALPLDVIPVESEDGISLLN